MVQHGEGFIALPLLVIIDVPHAGTQGTDEAHVATESTTVQGASLLTRKNHIHTQKHLQNEGGG